ncbi:hypothetical protein HNP84_002535 [Thermocatellispora tengchongensis]|uniref:DUF3467 domain-containing protein n=1 Tax=Thermocatellispora tengchongensis TaxID=1073253 RepID=A0A840NVJ8_9ACTN|nr:DUF3467 domain-containing protein [Thermocatellispora tengchongensis]MBB5132814.1 hypothetical protein [Thermocatellispora tengchongensis]
MNEEPESHLEVSISAEVEAGQYANFASVWHTRDGFVLDFAVITRPPQLADDPQSGQRILSVPTRIVSRIRLPPSQVFELMKALEQQLTAYEKETGHKV